jgi:mannosylglycoprotein endo-beta-mannosidase
MIVTTFNVRGLGSRVKRRKIRELVRRENVDFLTIQETKMEAFPDNFVASLWGSGDCDWASLPTVGNSGGILSIWNKVKLTLIFTFIGCVCDWVCLDFEEKNKKCFVINVYAKCNIRDKKSLWSNILMSKEGFGDGLWCVVGDFNSVRDVHERRGVNSSSISGRSNEIREFDSFLGDLDMIDLLLVGRNYTWYHPNGLAMSRLDRVLISPSWGDAWGDPLVRVLDRDVADHCPFLLYYSHADWGPKPFRFNNYWLQHKDFKNIVVQAWREHHCEGWMGFILKERLKCIKGVIKG